MSLGECGRVVVKSVCSVLLRHAPTIQCIKTSSCQYLLLSTTILNNIMYFCYHIQRKEENKRERERGGGMPEERKQSKG